jgi:hypothetical protein
VCQIFAPRDEKASDLEDSALEYVFLDEVCEGLRIAVRHSKDLRGCFFVRPAGTGARVAPRVRAVVARSETAGRVRSSVGNGWTFR